MSTSPYSLDLREKVIKYIKDGGSQISASKIFSLNKNTVNNWWLRYCSEGNVNPRSRPGAKPSVASEEFIKYVNDNPNLDAEDIGAHFGISASGARYWLKKVNFSYKKKAYSYMEACEKRREEFLTEVSGIDIEDLVFLDESGIEYNIGKDRGWAKIGEKLTAKKSGKHYERTNLLAGYVNKKPIAPLVFHGSCNTEFFNKWVEVFLIPELKPGQIVIMDNASFHKSPIAKELIEKAGCKLIFLPPYSPDLNPIEKFWANMKKWIKKQIHKYLELNGAINAFFNIL